MKLKLIDQAFTICKVEDLSQVNALDEYCFIGKTDEELSLVCDTRYTPNNSIIKEDGWRSFRIEGVLDFSLIGILSKISTLLAEAEIGIFVISTFNTDYILVKEENLEGTIEVLEKHAYEFIK